jgi:hypothetical protein
MRRNLTALLALLVGLAAPAVAPAQQHRRRPAARPRISLVVADQGNGALAIIVIDQRDRRAKKYPAPVDLCGRIDHLGGLHSA